MKYFIKAAGVLGGVALLSWAGLKIKPAAFEAFPQRSSALETIPLPGGLPAPVERYYHKVYGEQIPVIKSAVISGRASLRPAGPVHFPGRFCFTHEVGKNYRHYIEMTVFGLPFFKVNERYLDGKSRCELPFGVVSEGNQIDQAANLGMWAELAWIPATFLTDKHVRWEAVDENTAILVVPFEKEEERFIVRFDQESSMLRLMEVMRYKEQTSTRKSLWITETKEYGMVNGYPTMLEGTATWLEDGSAWAVFKVEEIAYNVEIKDYIRARGK